MGAQGGNAARLALAGAALGELRLANLDQRVPQLLDAYGLVRMPVLLVADLMAVDTQKAYAQIVQRATQPR